MGEEYTGYKFEPGARCNIEQYRRLLRCSDKKDITEWNEWRKANPRAEIWLAGARLRRAHLERADLMYAHLQGADLSHAHLEGARLLAAHLEGADLSRAHLEGADLFHAHLEGAGLSGADLKGADLTDAHLEGATLWFAHLERAGLEDAHLEGALLVEAHLERANLMYAHLEGAHFAQAIVDGETLISHCTFDKDTNFSTVGLDAARVEPGLKQTLEYNIRRKRWTQWYGRRRNTWFVRALRRVFGDREWVKRYDEKAGGWLGSALRHVVRPFWWMSDYGRSTWRIILTFILLALTFACVYFHNPTWLYGLNDSGMPIAVLHATYFSVVTMTTLGLGDIHATLSGWQGQALLTLQVLLGYVLLGALVTRFAVLFTAGGPAAKFTKRKKDKTPGG